MQLDKVSLFKYFCISIILMCLNICFLLYNNCYKYVEKNVFCICPKYSNTEYFFNKADLDYLLSQFENNISYEKVQNVAVSNKTQSASVSLIRTNEMYTKVNHLKFLQGSFWNEKLKGTKVIVLNKNLAWQLFGSLNVVGNKIELENKIYEVIGVIDETFYKDKKFLAWIPDEYIKNDIGIEKLYVFQEQYNDITSNNYIENLLFLIDKDINNYYIVDLNKYIENIFYRFQFILFIVIVCSIFSILKTISVKNINLYSLINKLMFLSVCIVIIFVQSNWDYVLQILKEIFNYNMLPKIHYLFMGLKEIYIINCFANILMLIIILIELILVLQHKKYKDINN